jgi:hypothetical protein
MRVKVTREHSNRHAPAGRKRVGAEYEVGELEARNLIASGLAEEVKAKAAEATDEAPAKKPAKAK